MQQLFLTGSHAPNIASRLFTALNIRPTGYRVIPFMVDGASRGDAMHFLLPPSPPLYNDIPFRVKIGSGRRTIIPQVLSEVAAPCLTGALSVHTPMLLCGVSGDMLQCEPFRVAVRDCLMSQRPVVLVAEDDALDALSTITPPERQQWFDIPQDAEERSALLEYLISEAAMRF